MLITILEKRINNDHFNYWKIVLLLPDLYIRKIVKDSLQEDEKLTRLGLNTEIEHISHRICWSFRLRILGFGFEIVRQTSY